MTVLDRRTMMASGLALPFAIAAPARARLVARRDPAGQLRFPSGPPVPTIDFHALCPEPVRLRALDVVEFEGDVWLRCTSTDGVEGVIRANGRLVPSLSLLAHCVAPALLGQDLRDIEALIDRAYITHYKLASLPFWTAVGHAELAAIDCMGKTIGRRVADMIGPVLRTSIPIYMSSLLRDTSPAEEVAWAEQAIAETGARAIKYKVGGRMSRNADAAPGRQEALTSALRRRFGDALMLLADSNGSFDVPTALGVAAMLEAHGVACLEEPTPYQEFEGTRAVTHAVDRAGWRIRVAGGEQDSALEMWRWMIDERALHVLQPDFMYNGGLLRTLMVARMAEAAGLPVAPHYPRHGSATVELLHFAAVTRNLWGPMEYHGRPPAGPNRTEPRIAPSSGALSLPPGPGFGVSVDPAVFKRGRRLYG